MTTTHSPSYYLAKTEGFDCTADAFEGVTTSNEYERVTCTGCRAFADDQLAQIEAWEATKMTSEVDNLTPAGEQLAIQTQTPDRYRDSYGRLEQLVSKASGNTTDRLVELDDLTEIIEQAERMRARAVDQARAAGASWSQIAQELGVTKQGAAQRYGKKG